VLANETQAPRRSIYGCNDAIVNANVTSRSGCLGGSADTMSNRRWARLVAAVRPAIITCAQCDWGHRAGLGAALRGLERGHLCQHGSSAIQRADDAK
jgi:hypothetical protein